MTARFLSARDVADEIGVSLDTAHRWTRLRPVLLLAPEERRIAVVMLDEYGDITLWWTQGCPWAAARYAVTRAFATVATFFDEFGSAREHIDALVHERVKSAGRLGTRRAKGGE